MTRGIKVGITGLPGAGKTQALVKVIEMLEEESLVVGGMITEPIVENGKRVGFYVMDWRTKRKAIFAHVETESKFYVGKYGVNLESLDTVGVEALVEAAKHADVIVIDEVGKMEVGEIREGCQGCHGGRQTDYLDIAQEIPEPPAPGHQETRRCPHPGSHANKQELAALQDHQTDEG